MLTSFKLKKYILKQLKRFNPLITKLLIWRLKHLNNQKFLVVLSIFLGIEAGAVVVLLKYLANGIETGLKEGFLKDYQNYLYFIFPLIGISLTVLYVKIFFKGKVQRGVPFILYSIGRNSGIIKWVHTFRQVITAALTVGFGGSVGLEAPAIVTGSAWGSFYGKFFHLNSRHKIILLGCGAAAAISAIFNSPIAGVIFVLEVLMTNVQVTFIIPLLIASVTGSLVSKMILSEKVLFHFSVLHDIELSSIPFYIFFGFFAGILALYFSRVIEIVHKIFVEISNYKNRLLIGGLILGALILLFPSLYGEGYWSLERLLVGNSRSLLSDSIFSSYANNQFFLLGFVAVSALLKVVATGLTREAGGNGGIFAPSMFVGGMMGFFFSRIINLIGIEGIALSETNFALVGMAGVAGGILHSPLTVIFLIAEITNGYQLFVPLMIVVAISYGTKIYFEPHSFYSKELAKKGDYLIGDRDRTILHNIKIKRVIEKDLVPVYEEGNLKDLVDAIAISKRNIFPVIDRNYEFKGIILLDNVRDIIFKPEMYEELLIINLMSTPPDYVELHSSMETVMNKFDQTGAWNLPVLDKGKYIGFLSKSKIFSLYRNQLKEHIV